MATSIPFYELAVGTVVTNQFSSQGIEFLVPGKIASGAWFANILQATEERVESSISHWLIKGRFVDPTQSYLGMDLGDPAALQKLVAFTSNGTTVAQSSYTTLTGRVEVFSPRKNIASFEIWFLKDKSSILSMEFGGTNGASPPEFRLVYQGQGVKIMPGEVAEAVVLIVRLGRSTGSIFLQATDLPQQGVFTRILPDLFRGPSGQSITLRFRAEPLSEAYPVIQNWKINITGLPEASAGTTIQQIHIPITVLEPYGPIDMRGLRVMQKNYRNELDDRWWTFQANTDKEVQYNHTARVLLEGKATFVKVYISIGQVPRRPPHVREVTLSGFREDGVEALPGSPFRRTLEVEQLEGLIFTLPISWTTGPIVLEASVYDDDTFQQGGNDTVEVSSGRTNCRVRQIQFFNE